MWAGVVASGLPYSPRRAGPPGAGRPHERPGAAPCKFNFACTRPDCFFAHPGGRAIDATPARHAPQQPHPTLGVPADPQLQNNINLPDSPFGVVEEQELENMLEEQERAADKARRCAAPADAGAHARAADRTPGFPRTGTARAAGDTCTV